LRVKEVMLPYREKSTVLSFHFAMLNAIHNYGRYSPKKMNSLIGWPYPSEIGGYEENLYG